MHTNKIIGKAITTIIVCIAIVAMLSTLIPRVTIASHGSVSISLTQNPQQADLLEYQTRDTTTWGYEYQLMNGDKVEVGNKATETFEPRIKLYRWDDECSLDLILPYTSTAKVIELNSIELSWSSPEADIKFYAYEKIGEENHEGFEFDITIKQKPPTNVVSAYFNYSNLEFYYQPPLTEEYKDGWSDEFQTQIKVAPTTVQNTKTGELLIFRPENVVGSYAVYKKDHSPMYSSERDAEKYRTGKAFHWYRPLMWDSSASPKYAWGDLHVDAELGIRTTAIPQDFYETATYPITIDDDFGYTGEGGSDQTIETYMMLTRGTPAASGTGVSITAYIEVTSQPHLIKCHMYGDGDGVSDITGLPLISNGATEEIDVPAEFDDSQTFNFSTGPSLTGGTYYRPAIWGEATAGTAYINYDTLANNDYYYDFETYGSWPDDNDLYYYGTDKRLSLYCTYTPGGGAPEITNTQSTWAMGVVDVDDVVYFSATGSQDDDYSQIENTGDVAVDVEIQGTNAEGGDYDWVLASSPSTEQYSLYANSSNGSATYNIEVKSSSYNDLVTDLAVDAVYNFSMKFTAATAGNANDDGQSKSATVTLVASEAS